jgi:hypothetical protein
MRGGVDAGEVLSLGAFCSLRNAASDENGVESPGDGLGQKGTVKSITTKRRSSSGSGSGNERGGGGGAAAASAMKEEVEEVATCIFCRAMACCC